MFIGIPDYRYCIVVMTAVTFSEGFLDNNLEMDRIFHRNGIDQQSKLKTRVQRNM